MVLQGIGRTPGREWCSRGQGGHQVEGGAPGDMGGHQVEGGAPGDREDTR